MNARAVPPNRWTTASIADAAETSPIELSQLGLHLRRCYRSRGRWFALRCSADAIHDFIAPRFVTTLFAAGTVIALAALAL